MDPNTQQQSQQPVQTAPQSAQQAMPTPQPVAGAAQTTVPQAPKSNKKLPLILLLMLVLVVAVGVAAYFYVMGNKPSNDQANVAQQKPTIKVTISPTPDVRVDNSTQLDSAINEVNGVSTTTIESELNQAVTEAKNL